MSKPTRIQRQRTKGWAKPDNTVNVARPSKWGNPTDWQCYVETGTDWLSDQEIAAMTPKELKARAVDLAKGVAAALFEVHLTAEQKAQIRTELRGKNLMCWCKVGDPCHADVLLEIANEPTND